MRTIARLLWTLALVPFWILTRPIALVCWLADEDGPGRIHLPNDQWRLSRLVLEQAARGQSRSS